MKPFRDDHASIFMSQLRREFPDLTSQQCAALASKRDAGIAAANRLTSTVKLTETQCGRLVKAMADAKEAIRVLVLQGLPWAFNRARKHCGSDFIKAIDMAVDSASTCAMIYDPAKGCLSTLIAHDMWFRFVRRVRCQEKQDRFLVSFDHDRVEEDCGHEYRAEEEKRRQRLFSLIAGVKDDRERAILTMRANGWKLREIAKELSLTKERIRQLQDRAVRSLKVHAGTATKAEAALHAKHQRGLARTAKIAAMASMQSACL